MMAVIKSNKKNKIRLIQNICIAGNIRHYRPGVLTKDPVINLLLIIFVIRPIIDLPYDDSIVLGINLAGLTAVLVLSLGMVCVIRHPRLKFLKFEYWLFIYMGIAFCSALIHLSNLSDFAYVARMLSSLVFLFCVAPRIEKDTLKKCYKLFIFASLIPIAISFMQVMHLVPFTYFDHSMGREIGRASGGYRHPSSLVRVVMFSIIYTFYLMENDWSKWKKNLCAVSYLALAISSIIISYLRSGYFTLVIIVCLWYFLKYKRNMTKLFCKVLGIGIIVILAFSVVYSQGLLQVNLQEFTRFFAISNIINKDAGGTSGFYLRGRFAFIQRLMISLKASPAYVVLFGNGVDVSIYNGINMKIADMHFIRLIWNCGIVGFAVWGVYILSFFKNIWKKRKRNIDKMFINMAICLFVFYFLWGITKEPTTQPNFMYHIFLIGGFVCHNEYLKKEGIVHAVSGKKN